MDKKVAVVIPFYKTALTAYEVISLQQCLQVLGNHQIIAIKPNGLTLPGEISTKVFSKIIEFDKEYFSGIAGYNRLMLSPEFYAAFDDFGYMLIYQLDALVFRDELNYWCNQNFDYIGAPWIRKKYGSNLLKSGLLNIQQNLSTQFDFKKNGVPNKYQFEGKVGNGGFSLRRVQKFKELTQSLHPKIEEYLKQDAHQYNEDAFWSIEVNRKQKLLNIPDWQTGLNFAFENYPENCVQYNNQQLPFGCHAWDKHLDFWTPVFKTAGIKI